ncbi:MAG: pyridoxal 5'-phosphate synthase glutaminase subunit PdxT [Halobacteriovoraceae bacterium]|nr:pyridoxal 5'-phosphate synthase glutaminase subunit PdxT [Halobacteriovoraceae bacterium]
MKNVWPKEAGKQVKRIGILALQGCVTPHIPHIHGLGCEAVLIKRKEDIKNIDAYILPGGESSTMLKLIDVFGLESLLREEFQYKPVWGICAGVILMAKTVKHPEQRSFGLIDITVERNGYGSQLDSKEDFLENYTITYIRAPIIKSISKEIEVLARRDDFPVWITDKNQFMGTTFHPELNNNWPSPMHRAFFELIK